VLTIPEALAVQQQTAVAKVRSTRRPVAYTVQSMLAGAYIGIAVVLMVSAAGPFVAAGSPAAKLVSGLVFGVALTLVVIAGGELVTSNMMTLTQGALARRVGWGQAGGPMLFCFAGNLLGAFAFAAVVHLSGVLAPATPGGAMIASMLEAKGSEPTTELFFRAVLCNVLVCLAVWSEVRLTSEGARLVVIFWCLLAFITSGFEHVVANMTPFGLGIIGGLPETSWAELGRNMLVVGLGNLVGGAVVVGLGYAVVAGPLRAATTTATASASPDAPGTPSVPDAAPASPEPASAATPTPVTAG